MITLHEGLHTTRTYPRLIRHRDAGYVAFAISGRPGGIVWLNGPSAGLYVYSHQVEWENFDDYVGSVTLHNAD